MIDEAGAHARLSTHTAPPEIKDIEKRLEMIRREKEDTIKEQDFEKAAALRDQERETKKLLDKTKKEWSESRSKIELEIGEDDIAKIIAKTTGIPISRLEEKESSRLLRIEEELQGHVMGKKRPFRRLRMRSAAPALDLKIRVVPLVLLFFWGPPVSVKHC